MTCNHLAGLVMSPLLLALGINPLAGSATSSFMVLLTVGSATVTYAVQVGMCAFVTTWVLPLRMWLDHQTPPVLSGIRAACVSTAAWHAVVDVCVSAEPSVAIWSGTSTVPWGAGGLSKNKTRLPSYIL